MNIYYQKKSGSRKPRMGPAVVALSCAIIGTTGFAAPVLAATWYVDGLNGSKHNPGTSAAPFMFMWQATQVVQPGDTVYLLPTILYPQVAITVSGTPGDPITVSGAGSTKAMTHVTGGTTGSAIWINANYITVTNFDVTATNSAQPAMLVNSGHHHVLIANNVAHNAGGNGISTFGADYVTISHNIVYGNAWYTNTGIFSSGISLLGNLDIDSSTATKMIVDGNVIYGNSNGPPSTCTSQSCLSTWSDTDGSGIIDDNSRRTRFDQIVYHGRTQISNNVIFGNGGRGIHIYLSDHVTIVDNTTYFNNQDPYQGTYEPGEIMAYAAGDVEAYDNLLYSDGLNGTSNTGTPSPHVGVSFERSTDGAGPLVAMYNLMFNPQNNSAKEYYLDPTNTNPVTTAQNIWNGPKLENPEIAWPDIADFRPKPISPALRTANVSTSVATDFLGAPRVAPPTIGAYENAGP